ncbi:hypothetical protein [Leyella stercorea]|uniref:hypothetical protein n=1 Tax=Leyella stercorea TaxID=363265 RepID=UPI003A8D750B
MKRLVLTLAVALVTALSASAQRLANIQVEARFITDKMVLELGLSNVQRNTSCSSTSAISMPSTAIAT